MEINIIKLKRAEDSVILSEVHKVESELDDRLKLITSSRREELRKYVDVLKNELRSRGIDMEGENNKFDILNKSW